jgi:hypothetical protein
MKIWTVGTAWYLCLPVYEAAKVRIARTTFYKYIKDLCDAVGKTRAEIGIITGVRAELYFDGGWSSVSLDKIAELSKKGTDVVFIEKQGVPEILTEYADKYGIAMVNTRGKLVEYAKDLMNQIDEDGGHAVIMADYDGAGVKIASECPSEIEWIGANDEMLQYFKLKREDVAVASESKRNKDHVKYLRSLLMYGKHPKGNYIRAEEPDERFRNIDVVFLETQRVELDAILAKVGDERFFEYIKDSLEELYPERDYNRAIDIEDLLLLKVPAEELGERLKHEDIVVKINDRIQYIIEPKEKEIKEELSDTEGFVDVKEKRKEVKQDKLAKVFIDDPDYIDFTKKLTELVESHQFFKKEIIHKENTDTKPSNNKTDDNIFRYIQRHGTDKQKQDLHDGKRTTDEVFSELTKGVKSNEVLDQVTDIIDALTGTRKFTRATRKKRFDMLRDEEISVDDAYDALGLPPNPDDDDEPIND